MKQLWKKGLAFVLVLVFAIQFTLPALAESDKSYVSSVILSYGETDDSAKQWLTDNGYDVLDQNLNEGADDILSHKRSVYLGYTTTSDPSNAITDIKLMHMQGGYSVQDYQKLLADQKENIRLYVNEFISALKEYRSNFEKKDARALQANELLNRLHDDDTGMNLGDLFLQPLKEELGEEAYASLSERDQKKHADMTTILMQGNTDLVLKAQQIVVSATDDTGTLWLERYADAPSYDTMLSEQTRKLRDPNKAKEAVAKQYDGYAAKIAEKVGSFREYLKTYVESGLTLVSDPEEIKAYLGKLEETERTRWMTGGMEYEALRAIPYDPEEDVEEDSSMAAVLYDEKTTFEDGDFTGLYPLVSVLTEGQKACLELLPLQQLVSLGMNTAEGAKEASQSDDSIDVVEETSVYAGVDRSFFGEDVALTNEALRLQQSSDKSYEQFGKNSALGKTTLYLYGATAVATAATFFSAFAKNVLLKKPEVLNFGLIDNKIKTNEDAIARIASSYQLWKDNNGIKRIALSEKNFADVIVDKHGCFHELSDAQIRVYNQYGKMLRDLHAENTSLEESEISNLTARAKYSQMYSRMQVLTYGCMAVAIILAGVSVWQTYEDLKAYYKADFTAIPLNMVNQSTDESGDDVFTYYKAALCNRNESGFLTDDTKILGSIGDLNGDVGKQWLALYTTKDEEAGDPILADFLVKKGSASAPLGKRAVSLFGNKDAQNLTDAKNNMTYDDDLNGLYLYFGSEKVTLAGSVFSAGSAALFAGCGFLIGVLGTLLVVSLRRKKKDSKEPA